MAKTVRMTITVDLVMEFERANELADKIISNNGTPCFIDELGFSMHAISCDKILWHKDDIPSIKVLGHGKFLNE